MGEQTFRRVQYGIESAKGTPVAATRIWPGTVSVPSDRQPQRAKFMDGTRFPGHKRYIGTIQADGIGLVSDAMIFQSLPMLFSIGLKGGVTPTEQTPAQQDYLWTIAPSWTATNAQKALTLEYGDDTQAYEIEYTMARSIKLSGKVGSNEPVKAEATLFGAQITPTTFTGSLALPGTELMLADQTQIYFDALFANVGTTEVTGLLREWSVEFLTGLHPKHLANGTKIMNAHGESVIDAIATLTFEGNATADTYFDLFQAGTERAMQLKVSGPQIGTGAVHSLKVNMFGGFDEVIPLGSEQDGNNLHTAIFSINSDRQAAANALAVLISTNVNAAI